MRTRMAELPRPLAWLVLGLTLAAMVVLVMVAMGRAPLVPADAGAVAAPEGDLVSYQRIIERMRGGADYYTAAHDVPRDEYLAAWGIPTVRISGKDAHGSPMGAACRVAGAVQAQLEGV